MKLTTFAIGIATAASLPLISANGGGFNENVLSCRNANFKDCKTISLIGELDTCQDIPDPTHFKYGDMHSSFQVNGRMACRLFRTRASSGCKDPSVEPIVNLTGKDNQRATNWFAYPGFTDWPGRWKFSSFYCTSLEGKTLDQLPKVVVADCGVDDDVEFGCDGLNAVA